MAKTDRTADETKFFSKSFLPKISPIVIVSGTLLLTVLAGAFATFTILGAYRHHEAALRLDARLQTLSTHIVHYEDTKDMAALMGVETADPLWRDRYEAEVERLDRVLREAINEAPDRTIRDQAVETDTIKVGLVHQERMALTLAMKGDSRRAWTILSSPQYVFDDQRYRKEMAEFNTKLRIWIMNCVRTQEANIERALAMFSAVGVALLVIWLGVVRMLRRNIAERCQHVAELSDAVERLTVSEKTLKESEERYQYALRATSDIIWDWDAKNDTGGVLSPNFCEAFGIRSDVAESPYEQWLNLIHPEDRLGLEESLRARATGNASFWEFQYRLRRPDRSYATFHDRAYILRDERGAPVRLIGAMQDISRRKEQEAAIAEAAVSRAASKAKSEFLANMSHEIRTPLNGIIGMTELTLATPCTAEQTDYLQSIEYSAQALLSVINDVLDFSKIEANKLDLNVTEMVPAEIVEQAVKTMAVSAHRKGLELNCDIDPEVPACVVGDPFRLRQVLINLIGNAVKFTTAGEVNVRLRRVNGDSRTCRLAFSVSDTGIGIPPEKQAIIFDKFTQADSSTSRVYGGTGLGLAISRALVEMMDGKLDLVSSTIEGSTFSFELSLPVGHSLKPAAEPALDGLRVLVVDDNETNRAILVRTLAGWQMEVATACDGEEALTELRRASVAGTHYDVVLTDAKMPRLGGFGLVERLKQDSALTHTAILMLTSNDQAGDAACCRALGINLYLVKPARQVQLKDALRKAIGHSSPTEAKVSRPIAPVSAGSLRILLAEDNLVNQKFAVRSLEKLHHTVTVASTGLEALRELENSVFDLVLMDVQMPEMDGFEATAVIRTRAAEYRNIPIIAMTAHAMQGDRERCLAAGMTDYLSKPLKIADLGVMIEKYSAARNEVPGDGFAVK